MCTAYHSLSPKIYVSRDRCLDICIFEASCCLDQNSMQCLVCDWPNTWFEKSSSCSKKRCPNGRTTSTKLLKLQYFTFSSSLLIIWKNIGCPITDPLTTDPHALFKREHGFILCCLLNNAWGSVVGDELSGISCRAAERICHVTIDILS